MRKVRLDEIQDGLVGKFVGESCFRLGRGVWDVEKRGSQQYDNDVREVNIEFYFLDGCLGGVLQGLGSIEGKGGKGVVVILVIFLDIL